MKPYYEEAGIQLFLGDCRDILPHLAPGSADMVLTDPPYGMGRVTNDGKDFLEVVGPALRLAWDILVDCGSMFVFTSTGEVVNVANSLGHPLKRLLWLYKPADCTYPLAGWLLKSEAILWFAKGKHLNLADRHPYMNDTYVHTPAGDDGVRGHPTVKPLWVMQSIANRCPEGGLLLDPFLGSGTTAVAAKRLGLRCIGIEIEERYVELAVKRLAQMQLDLQPPAPETPHQLELARCDAEIAAAEAELRAGNPDVQGLLLGLADWRTERQMIEEEEENAR